jgi:hypothetical protein
LCAGGAYLNARVSRYYLLVHNREIITPLENNNYTLWQASVSHNGAAGWIAIAANGTFLCGQRDMKPPPDIAD